jgi:hypothetical protein
VGNVVAGPMLDASGTRMVFAQAGNGTYFTSKSGGTWKRPAKIQISNLPLDLNGVASFNGIRLFFAEGGRVNYVELQSNGFWSRPVESFEVRGICELPRSVGLYDERLAIAPDQQLIVLSGSPERDLSKSKLLLYYATKANSRGQTAYANCKPVSLHTDAAEIRPILLSDGKTLLYIARTEQWDGVNNKKIVEQQYVTQLLDNGTWALPQPTGGDKFFYTWASVNMDTAYFRTTSGRIGYAVDPAGVIMPRPVVVARREVTKTVRAPVAEPVVEKKTTPAIVGRYYALLIGVSDYENDKLDLTMPVNDVKAMKNVLTNSYSFDESDITILDNPTRQGIFKELSRLRNTLTERDNLLIFFAGHGSWDKKINQGYWWPSNSSPDDPSNWLSNSDLREQIRGIPSAHTLLISDACFSGGIFRTRNAEDIKKAPIEVVALYKMKSRRAITSGALSSVPDESVFIRYLIKRLEENPDNYLPSQSLFNSMRLAVIHNSLTVPQDGVISDAGDEGGDFIFIRRQ